MIMEIFAAMGFVGYSKWLYKKGKKSKQKEEDLAILAQLEEQERKQQPKEV